MPEASSLILFLAAALALLVTPGPAVLYIVARSVDQGPRAGVVASLGMGTGALFHIAAAALGISVILVSSAAAFSVFKYLGAAYLVYLGIRKLSSRDEAPAEEGTTARDPSRIYRESVVVNVLNPKTALFFFAFLPQFADPSRGSVALQIVALGLLFVSLGLVTDSLYALAAGGLGNRLRSARVVRPRRYIVGGVYILLGLATAVTGIQKK